MSNETATQAMNRLEPRDRYGRDPQFSHLVNMLRSLIHRAEFTPTELREALILALTIEEQEKPHGPWVVRDGKLVPR